MPYQRGIAHRLGFEPESPDYETTALPTELSIVPPKLLTFVIGSRVDDLMTFHDADPLLWVGGQVREEDVVAC